MYLVFITCLLFVSTLSPHPVSAQLTEQGRMEWVDGQKILHLKGSPYEIGHQHGCLLKKEIAYNLKRFIEPIFSSDERLPPVVTHFLEALPGIARRLPEHLMEEMLGVADGSEQSFKKILLLNLFPEMFHCTGITVQGEATKHGELYHVRVLDYAAGNGLQHTAVLAVVEPKKGIPFLNVTYAGFVGCVTGMNLDKITIGEIGGKGYGHWKGIPMAFLLRTILQYASNLDDVKHLLETTERTCEYYYVFSDGKTGQSLGCYATSDLLKFLFPGETYSKFPSIKNTFDPPSLFSEASLTPLSYEQPKDILMITRGNQYGLLQNRLLMNYGSLDIEDLKQAIKEPVACSTNLHNAIFAPETLDVWISHAGLNNEPACDEPYHHFNLKTLLGQ